jgi:hypothetical protein
VAFYANLRIAGDACVTDVSKSGLGLITDQPIPSDVLLKVTLDGAIILVLTT